MSLLPKRGLSYTRTGDLAFVDERSICYPFGSRTCTHNLNPDEGGGDGVFLGDIAAVSATDSQSCHCFYTITAIATSWREGIVGLATAGIVSPSIVLYSYPDRKERGRLDGHCLFYNGIAFSRGSDRIVGFGNHSSSEIIVWAVTKEESSSVGGGRECNLWGQKLVSTSLRGNINFCDFNPTNENHILTGGKSGLVMWNTVDLEDEWHITRKQIALMEDSAVVSYHPLKEYTKRPFTCHAWGKNGMLWVGLRNGEIQCFNSKDGGSTDQRQPLHISYLGGHSTPTGLIYTRDHLIVVTEEGNVYWYSLPSECEPTSLVFSVALEGANNQRYRVSKVVCSPIFDQFVVGTKNGVLLSLPLEHSRHKKGGVVNATELTACHVGVVLCCIGFHSFHLSVYGGFNAPLNIIATGGEDGCIWLRTVEHGKPCGLRQFLQEENNPTCCAARTKTGDGSNKSISPSFRGTVSKSITKKTAPVTALASSLHFPLIAAGLCNGVVHILFQRIATVGGRVAMQSSEVTTPSNQMVSLTTIWQERLYGDQMNEMPVNLLEFHPTVALLAVASSSDRMLHVVDMRLPERWPFKVCAYVTAPHDEGGNITSLVWRNQDIVFTTSSKLICCVSINMSTAASAVHGPSTLKWVLQTSIPLHGICRNPATPPLEDPFFGVSRQCQSLLMLPTLPHDEETAAARSSKPSFTPVEFLSEVGAAYQQSCSIICSSQCGQFLVTGGIDGYVTLWGMNTTQNIEQLDRVRLHSGPVLDLCFSPDSTHVYSSGTDGTVMNVQLLLNSPMGGTAQREAVVETAPGLVKKASLISMDTTRPPSEILTYASQLATALTTITTQVAVLPLDENQILYSSYEPINQIVWREKNGYNHKPQPQLGEDKSDKGISMTHLVDKVNNLKDRLLERIHANSTLPDIEKLEPEDFLIDINGRELKQCEIVNTANNLRKELRDNCINKELICGRIVTTCQRSMEVFACEIRGLCNQGLVVDNFALSKRDTIDVHHMVAIRHLRALELKDIRRSSTTSTDESSSSPSTITSSLRTWNGLHNEIPNNVSWILTEGSQVPVVDIVAEIEERKRRVEKFPGIINNKKFNDFTNHDDQFEKSKNGNALDLDIAGLLYPPWALRTPRQLKTQIILLENLVWDMRIAFNKHFQALVDDRKEIVENLRRLNEQLDDISGEIGMEEEESLLLCEPKWYSKERMDNKLQITNTTTKEEDMIKHLFTTCCMPPMTMGEEATNKAENNKASLDEEKTSHWEKEKALKHMTNGNPKILGGIFHHNSLPLREWIGKENFGEDSAALTPEQENQVAIYEQAAMSLEEKNQRRHMAKKLEAKKLLTEIINLRQIFDDRVRELASMRLEVQQRIKAQELNITCLSIKLMEHHDMTISMKKLDKSTFEANKKRDTCKERLLKFKKYVKIVRDKTKALETHDRSLEMSFRMDIREAALYSIDEMDIMPQLIQLYKLRENFGDGGGCRSSGMENSSIRDEASIISGSVSSARVMSENFSGEIVSNRRKNTFYNGS